MARKVFDDNLGAPELLRRWKSSPALRAEFGNRFLSYYYYTKAAVEGRAKIYGPAARADGRNASR